MKRSGQGCDRSNAEARLQLTDEVLDPASLTVGDRVERTVASFVGVLVSGPAPKPQARRGRAPIGAPRFGYAAFYFAGVTGNITCAQGVPFHITNGPPLAGSVERLSSSFGFTGMIITCGPV